MKKIIYSLLFFVVGGQMAFSQHIKGIVISNTSGKSLPDTHIYHEKSGRGTVSDYKGAFAIVMDSNIEITDTLTISHIGYLQKKLSISNLAIDNIVRLEKTDEELNQVTVTSKKRKLKPRIAFERLSSLKEGIRGTASAVFNDKIYIIGGDRSYEEDAFKKTYVKNPRLGDPGTNLLSVIRFLEPDLSWYSFSGDIFIYDIKKDTWNIHESKFRKRAYHNLNLYRDTLLVLGGKRLSKNGKQEYLDGTIELMDLKSSKVVVDETNPHQSANFASIIYKSNLLVLGGSTKVNTNGWITYSDKIHFYDLDTGLWYELGKMTKPKETQGVLIEDKLFLIGGFCFRPLKSIETYDMITGKWHDEGELFKAMSRPGVTVKDKTIYIFEKGKLLAYDSENKVLKEYLIALKVIAPELQYHNNYLYIIGGLSETEFSKTPEQSVFRINLDDLGKTNVNRTKHF